MDAVSEWAEATGVRIEAEGGSAISVVADVTNPEDCGRAVETAVERYGARHVLNNNVRGGGRGSVVKRPTTIGSGARRST